MRAIRSLTIGTCVTSSRATVGPATAVSDSNSFLWNQGHRQRSITTGWLLPKRLEAALNRVGPGVNYLEVCRQASGSSATDAREALSGIRAVLKDRFNPSHGLCLHTRAGQAYFRWNRHANLLPGCPGCIAHMDITELQLSRDRSFTRLQEVGRRLINAQERNGGESRENYMTIWQQDRTAGVLCPRHHEATLEDSGSACHRFNQVISNSHRSFKRARNLSHCLHPPLLGYLEWRSAEMLCEEFWKNARYPSRCCVPARSSNVFPYDVELCIFRISQECLQNIAKHSGADSARVRPERTRARPVNSVDHRQGFLLESECHPERRTRSCQHERTSAVHWGRLEVDSSAGRAQSPVGSPDLPEIYASVQGRMSLLRIA